MKDLMIHVEQAVRPVRASIARKLAMREELFGHIRGIYEEEFQRLGDRDKAVREAVRRFGTADELSTELRTSVPWYDVVLRIASPFPPCRTWPHTVASLTIWHWMFDLVLVIPLLVFTAARVSSRLELAAAWLLSTIGVLALRATFYGFAGACHGILRQRKSSFLALLYSIGLCCFLVGAGLLVRPPGTSRFVIAGYVVALALMFALMSMLFARKVRRFEETVARSSEWDELDISRKELSPQAR